MHLEKMALLLLAALALLALGDAQIEDENRCELEDESSLLQIGDRGKLQKLKPGKELVRDTPATFISGDGLQCVEGQARAIVGALGLKQAGPRGALYSHTLARSQQGTCSSQGYSLNEGEDPTYVGVTLHYRNEAEKAAFAANEASALDTFRQQYNVSVNMASLMADCTAHTDSAVGHAVRGTCHAVDAFKASWMHHDVHDHPDREHCCDEGGFQKAVFSLAVLKTTKQYPQHPHDQIKVGSCESYGYWSCGMSVDHCFSAFEPGSTEPTFHMSFWENPSLALLPNSGTPAASEAEFYLFHNGGFEEYCHANGLDPVMMDIMASQSGCHCLPGSEVFTKTTCSSQSDFSPIREWWP